MLSARIEANRRFLTDLFVGPFPGHGVTVNPYFDYGAWNADVCYEDDPLEVKVGWGEANLERQIRLLERLEHDHVPVMFPRTGTHIFAEAIGCRIHKEDDNNAFALPLVFSAEEADRLSEPDIFGNPLDRWWEWADAMVARNGTEFGLGMPDMQSPFDIAALIWHKEDLFLTMVDDPAAVHRLVDKVYRFQASFFDECLRRYPSLSPSHCPSIWAPRETGIWLSEDEAGAMSPAMFEEFCLPTLVGLSERFGALSFHCCATADHQYGNFRKIPNLRGVNRVFQAPGPEPAIRAFSDGPVLVNAWMGREEIDRMLDLALPTTRYLFNLDPTEGDESFRLHEHILRRIGRG